LQFSRANHFQYPAKPGPDATVLAADLRKQLRSFAEKARSG
jgi:hypothetical protein